MKQDDTRFLELLDRWSLGDFTRADERALRELIATDDFRREAWEGLLLAPEADHAARLASLRMRLLGRAPGAKRIAWPQLLAAAAAVAALVMAVMVFFPRWNQDATGPVAQTKVEGLPSNPELPATAPAPEKQTTPTTVGPPMATESQARQRAETGATADDLGDARQDIRENELAISEEKTALRPESAPPADAAADKALAKPRPQANQPVATSPAAPPSAGARDERAKKSKSMPAPAGRTDSTRRFYTDSMPDMKAVRKDARKAALNVPTVPEGGWDAFAEYLRQNARLTPEARNNNISGTVRLQFNVNDNGVPQNFRILRGLGYGCDLEAIRLIQEYREYSGWQPGWEPVIVEVKFVR